jgi:hypothetical protein
MSRIIASAAVLLFLCACNSNSEKSSPNKTVSDIQTERTEITADSTSNNITGTSTAGIDKPLPQANPEWSKKIIKDAVLNAEVKDFNNYYNEIKSKINTLGGYISTEQQSQSDYKLENNITIKIPVDQFDNAMTVIATGVKQMNSKSVNSQDVSAEFVDTRARMQANMMKKKTCCSHWRRHQC